MPRLPSSADVPTVSPRVQADPGVRVPAGATQTTLGVAATELAPAGQALAEAAIRQQNRRDTVDRSSRINAYNNEADALLREMNVKADLSDEAVLSDYAARLTRRRQELLGEHKGSEDSRAVLATRLQQVESAHFGRAAALSTSLGREKVLTTFNEALTPLVNRAAQTPTRDTIDQLYVDLKAQIDDLRGAVDPTDEERLRTIGREQIALASLQSLIIRGRIETAEAMLDQGGVASDLTPQSIRDMRVRIETMKAVRDEGVRKIVQMESVLGRPLTDDEKLSAFGIGQKAPLVSIAQEGETARAKTEGEFIAKITTEQIPNVRRQLGQIEAMQNMIERGTETGGFRRLQLAAANFFGTTPESLTDLAALQAVSNAATLSKTSELKGAISERELDFVQAAVASAGSSTQANKAILAIQSKLLERERDTLQLMANYHTARGTLAGFDDYLELWAETNPMFTQDEVSSLRADIVTQGPLDAGTEQVTTVQDQAGYDALPNGARYTVGDGQIRIKGGATDKRKEDEQ